jgi:LysR family glycine cleavage system transcriptional activator
LKRPRLNQLRTFEVAARHQSFSVAAQELKISQAAVSQQMRQLEDYLDATLFDRQYRRLSLTSVGQAYFEVVQEAIDRLDTVTDQLFPGRDRKTVSLLCTSSVAALWLLPQLKPLQALHPDIDLRINTLDRNRGPSGLNSDLEIFIGADGQTDVNADQLLTSTITPVCSPQLLEQRGRPTEPADLLEFDLIHILGYEDDWHRWFRRNGVKQVRVPDGLSVDSSLIAIEAVQRGEGVMLGRRPFIDYLVESTELVEVFSESCHLYSVYYLRHLSSGLVRPEVDVVANWVRHLTSPD